MSTKHTPGPWKYEYGQLRIHGIDGQLICSLLSTAEHDSRLPNGFLIAAAPEMLEALNAMYELFPRDDSPRYRAALEMAAKAIAKAEGL